MTPPGVSLGWETRGEAVSLTRDLASVPDAVKAALRGPLRVAGQRVMDKARTRASWSSRIPGAMRMRVRLTGDRPGVVITVDSGAAPHARPFEGLLGGESFRHPVFGYGNAWVEQATRPFLWPTAAAEAPSVAADIRDAIDDALRAHNL